MDCKPSVSTSVRSQSGNRHRSSVAAPSSFSLVGITSSGWIAATMARKCKALVWSKRLRNHPCASVTTNGVVTNRGRLEKSLAKRACHRSDRSAKAVSAEVSTCPQRSSPYTTSSIFALALGSPVSIMPA